MATDTLPLSARWAPRLTSQAETGMGYWVTRVVLKDGRTFDRTVIVGGIISSIRNTDGTPLPKIPFVEDDIADIVVTHEKWPGFPK